MQFNKNFKLHYYVESPYSGPRVSRTQVYRRGYFWGDRFKSVIVENGETLINCLAYIDLNPLRASLVDRPEQYRWNSLTDQGP